MRRLKMTEDLYKQKRSLELRWQLEYEQSGKYTLNMVEIDNTIKGIITEIKLEERRIADVENAVQNAGPRSFCGNLDKRHIAEIVIFYRRISCTL